VELQTVANPFGNNRQPASRQAINDGQAQRFKRLAWPHLAGLLRTARYLTRHQQEAEDVVQETMLKAMKAIDSFQEGTDVKAWLMTILRRTFIDRLRASRSHQHEVRLDAGDQVEFREETATPGELDDRWDNPEKILDQFEDKEIVETLNTLPDEIRWTLLLVDVEQLDYAGAARVLEVPVGTIKSRAHRGRGMLRDRLFTKAQQRGWVEIKA
jgi:RNA polymerase sigma-70 factor (ECF subfamily)